MKCADVRETLPSYLRDGDTSLSVRRHLATCDDCRAELARYEELVGSLAGLRGVTAEAPPQLVAALSSIPQNETRTDALRGHLARNRSRYVGGAVALAGVAGAFAWRTRRHRLVTA